MSVLNNFRNEKGQGLVEYGLILALISVVAVSAIGGVGDKVTESFDGVNHSLSSGIYTDEEIDQMIADGYVPITGAKELMNIALDEEGTYGKGTKWEGSYVPGLSNSYIQVSNINLSGISNFVPIGSDTIPFRGVFDGGGYEISNLSIDGGDYVGLFGKASGAEFKNIGIINVNIKGGFRTGSLVGYQYGSSRVINSYATGRVKGANDTGGLVGYQDGGSLVENSHTSGKVTGTVRLAGGLVGGQADNSFIKNSYSMSKVYMNGRDGAGGLIGGQRTGHVVKSYATGEVYGSGSDVGGLVGYQRVGSSIINSYASGFVSGKEDAGGLVGQQNNKSRIESSYAVGRVIGNGHIGGLLGRQYDNSTVLNSYFDMITTTHNASAGGIGVQSLITTEMKDRSSFSGWDFDNVWVMVDGQYPLLR